MLPPLHIRYQFDPSGDNVANYVAGEVHILPLSRGRIIVPRNGAFYSASLKIMHNNHALVAGRDYVLAGFYQDATNETGQAVNVMIHFLNPEVTGEVSLFYQVVGGKFTGTFETIEKYVNALLVDPRKVRWDDILDKPAFFVPKEHFHDIQDVYGLNVLAYKLEEIRQAISRMRSEELRSVYSKMTVLRGELRQLIDITRQSLEDQIHGASNTSETLNTVKAKVEALVVRVSELENHERLNEEVAKLRAADSLASTKLVNLEQTKVNKDELSQSINEVKGLIDTLRQEVLNNQANNEALNALKTRVDNILSTSPDNLLEYEKSPSGELTGRITLKRLTGEEVVYYVNAQSGDDNQDGSRREKAFRSLSKIKTLLLPNVNIKVVLQGTHPHVLNPADLGWILQSARLSIQGGETTPSQISLPTSGSLTNWIIGKNAEIQLDNLNVSLIGVTNAYALFKGSNNYIFTRSVSFNTGENTELNIIDCQSPRQVILDVASLSARATSPLVQGQGKILGYLKTGIKLAVHRDVEKATRYQRLPVNLTEDNVTYLKQYIPSLRKSYLNFADGIDSNLDPALFELKPGEVDVKTSLSHLQNQITMLSTQSGVGYNQGVNTPEAIKGANTALIGGNLTRIYRNQLKINNLTDDDGLADYNGLSIRSQDGDGQHTLLMFMGRGNHWIVSKDGQYENDYTSEQLLTSLNLGEYVNPHSANRLRLENGRLLAGPFNEQGEGYRYYIDPVHGQDSPEHGSKTQPLRSVDYCLTQKVKTGTINNIYLKAGHTHSLSALNHTLDVYRLNFNIYGEQSVAIKAESQPFNLTSTEVREAHRLGTRLLCNRANTNGSILPAFIGKTVIGIYNLILEMQSPSGGNVYQSFFNRHSDLYCELVNIKLKLPLNTALINGGMKWHQSVTMECVEGYDIIEGEGKFLNTDPRLIIVGNNTVVSWFTKEKLTQYFPATIRDNGRWHNLFKTNLTLPSEWKVLPKEIIPVSKLAGNRLINQVDGLYVNLPEGNAGGGASSEELGQLRQLIQQLSNKVSSLESDSLAKDQLIQSLQAELLTTKDKANQVDERMTTVDSKLSNEVRQLKQKELQHAAEMASTTAKVTAVESQLATKLNRNEFTPINNRVEQAMRKATEAFDNAATANSQIGAVGQRVTTLKQEVDANTNFRNSFTFEYVDEPSND